MSTVEVFFLAIYFGVLAVLSIYGSHRYRMAYLYYRHKFQLPTPKGTLKTMPPVTIQLPIFNEMYVVERLIDAQRRLTTLEQRLRDRDEQMTALAKGDADGFRLALSGHVRDFGGEPFGDGVLDVQRHGVILSKRCHGTHEATPRASPCASSRRT